MHIIPYQIPHKMVWIWGNCWWSQAHWGAFDCQRLITKQEANKWTAWVMMTQRSNKCSLVIYVLIIFRLHVFTSMMDHHLPTFTLISPHYHRFANERMNVSKGDSRCFLCSLEKDLIKSLSWKHLIWVQSGFGPALCGGVHIHGPPGCVWGNWRVLPAASGEPEEGWRHLRGVRQDAASWGYWTEENVPSEGWACGRRCSVLGCPLWGRRTLLVGSDNEVGRRRGNQSVGGWDQASGDGSPDMRSSPGWAGLWEVWKTGPCSWPWRSRWLRKTGAACGGATCWDAESQVGSGWDCRYCLDAGPHEENVGKRGQGREQKGRWGYWLHVWALGGGLAWGILETLGRGMGSYCRVSGNAGGAEGQMQDGSGGDDGVEILKDDIRKHWLNPESFQISFVNSQQFRNVWSLPHLSHGSSFSDSDLVVPSGPLLEPSAHEVWTFPLHEAGFPRWTRAHFCFQAIWL